MDRKALWGFVAGVILTAAISFSIARHYSPAEPVRVMIPLAAVSVPAPPVLYATPQEPLRAEMPAASAPLRRAIVQPAVWIPQPEAQTPELPAWIDDDPPTAPETESLPDISSPIPTLPRIANQVVLAANTQLTIRTSEKLSSKFNKEGDAFAATLDQPLVIDGFIIADRGARVEGRVTEAQGGARVKGTAQLSLELTTLFTADGQKIAIRTGQFTRKADPTPGNDLGKIAFGTALGAAVGAAAGHGKGAAIGAAAGTAAGVGAVLLTHGEPVEMRAETRIDFRITEPVTITEKLNN